MAYYPHNIHFLWFAATSDGAGQLAIESARKLASKVDDDTLKELPLTAGFRVVPYYALTRFGRWDEMLKEPEPPASSAVLRAVWHYARGCRSSRRAPSGGRAGAATAHRARRIRR